MDPRDVAGAVLRGVKVATSSARLCKLTTIRLILFKCNVFLAFKEEATQMFDIEDTVGENIPFLITIYVKTLP